MSTPPDRPRQTLVPEEVCRFNERFDRSLRATIPGMDFKRWKALRITLVTAGVLSFAAWVISQGADPTATGLLSIFVVALLNGIDAVELAAFYSDFREAQQDGSDDSAGR